MQPTVVTIRTVTRWAETMKYWDYSKAGAIALGNELRELLDREGVSLRQFVTILEGEGYLTDASALSRAISGSVRPSAWLIQAIARNRLIANGLPVPVGYSGGSRTDYLLDRMAGRDFSETGKTGLIADINLGNAADLAEGDRAPSALDSNQQSYGCDSMVARKNREAGQLLAAQIQEDFNRAARLTGLTVARLRELKNGLEPTLSESLLLARLFPGSDISSYASKWTRD